MQTLRAMALVALISSWGGAAQGAEFVTFQKNGLSVQVPRARAEVLRGYAAKFQRAGIPGFVNIYKMSPKAAGSFSPSGATLEVYVDRDSVNKWFNVIGDSIGFVTRDMPNRHSGPSSIRIGEQIFDFRAVRGMNVGDDLLPNEKPPEKKPGGPDKWVPLDIRGKASPYSEVTFPVTRAEKQALTAFILARHYQLFEKDGQKVAPVWRKDGAKIMTSSGNFRENLDAESCAHAVTSMLNPVWQNLFVQNLARIQKYGRDHNIPALAQASAQTIETIKGFQARTGVHVATGHVEILRTHYTVAPVVTVFNMKQTKDKDAAPWDTGLPQGERSQRLIDTLKWSFIGLTAPRVLPSRPADNQAANAQNRRMFFSEIAAGL